MKYAWSVAMASIFERYNIKESDRTTDWHRLKHFKITNVCRKLTIDNSDLGVIQPKALSGMLGVQDLSIINSKIDKVQGYLLFNKPCKAKAAYLFNQMFYHSLLLVETQTF